MKSSAKRSTGLTISTYAAGILGALLASALVAAWQTFAPGAPMRLPDRYILLLISVFIGLGCARAGANTGPALSDLFASNVKVQRTIPIIYTFIVAATTALIVHTVLLFMLSV